MIQDVKTRWNSTFKMLERASDIRDTIRLWLNDGPMKLHVLWLSKVEWDQVDSIVDLLRPFQQIIESLGSSNQPSIHKAWIVYNVIHTHLEHQAAQLRSKTKSKWADSLQEAIEAAQVKLRKYYGYTSGKAGVYFNVGLYLNPYEKLDYYSVSFYSVGVILDHLYE